MIVGVGRDVLLLVVGGTLCVVRDGRYEMDLQEEDLWGGF